MHSGNRVQRYQYDQSLDQDEASNSASPKMHASTSYSNFTPEQNKQYFTPTRSEIGTPSRYNNPYSKSPMISKHKANNPLPPIPRIDTSSSALLNSKSKFTESSSPTVSTGLLPHPYRNNGMKINELNRTSAYSENNPSPRASYHSSSSQLYSPISAHSPLGSSESSHQTLTEQYDAMSPDPSQWGAGYDYPEKDDDLHNPDPKRDWKSDSGGSIFTQRGLLNIGCLLMLALILISLFLGYPVLSAILKNDQATKLKYTQNSQSDQINSSLPEESIIEPIVQNLGNLIDSSTPKSAYTRIGSDGLKYKLMFSDEFEVPGRSFYDGDDPYWTANDLHYWATNNSEWSSPRRVSTRDGNMVITLDKFKSHNMEFEGGMVTTWNKFCFTGGYIESSVMLPGSNNVWGLWPAIWLLGNLGRPGYGATLDGMWPYSYDSCDVGTLANQTMNGLPVPATNTGYGDGPISYLPGQRLSSCTCHNDDDHPGPRAADGGWIARSAPEIDVFEAQVQALEAKAGILSGFMSQSSQFAPFDSSYTWINTSDTYSIFAENAYLNTYKGSRWQESTSVVVPANQDCYQYNKGCFAIYGMEYWPGHIEDNAYMTWYSDNKQAWRVNATAFPARPDMEIGPRSVPREPMQIVANLAISSAFGDIDYEGLASQFPVELKIDYVRVYQREDSPNIGCSPPDYPTADYIEKHKEAYHNYNLTTWSLDYKQKVPRNNLTSSCSSS